jgi:thymidylate synthase
MRVRNVGFALSEGLRYLELRGVKEASRNGPVTVAPGPVVTVTEQPLERVLFSGLRDANPFFHLFESLWMLAGSNDLKWLSQFNKRMAKFSDDGGTTQPGAYGYRWRHHFCYDQLELIVEQLATDPNSRRAVLTMWDGGSAVMHVVDNDRGPAPDNLAHANGDLNAVRLGSTDVPCNTQCFFRVNQKRLDMTVLCRSNDLLWGAHGANAVHFSILQEYIAERLGLPVGEMIQFSNNYHLYDDVLKHPSEAVRRDAVTMNFYPNVPSKPRGIIMQKPVMFEADCIELINGQEDGFEHPFFKNTVAPMLAAWHQHKARDYDRALATLQYPDTLHGWDWRLDAQHWLMRRKKNYDAKTN